MLSRNVITKFGFRYSQSWNRGFSSKHFRENVIVSDEVKQAISENVPVVALESTIITHGLPYPENISMAKDVEKLIRQNGAVPASIGFVKGVPTVGLSESHIELLGQPDIHNVKISRRDIANVLTRKLTGGTTIAGTMLLANMAGIDVFATGGLGGVSRPWSLFDVSADLDELSKTPVAVVCSGPKSILDIKRTMEYLETKGVPVATYVDDDMLNHLDSHSTRRLQKLRELSTAESYNEINRIWETQGINVPGFYVRDSGVRSPFVWESPAVAAEMIHNGKYVMGMENGYVFCAPAPVEAAMDNAAIDKVIDEALSLAEKNNVTGKHLTPFMLQTLYQKTNGASAKCNVTFVKNNTVLGSKIASELCLVKGGKKSSLQPQPKTPTPKKPTSAATSRKHPNPSAVVIGSVALDTMCQFSTEKYRIHDSNPGSIKKSSVGGVGFNVALAATSCDPSHPVVLISGLNKEDNAGAFVLKQFEQFSMPQDGLIHFPHESTAQYISMHDSKGELALACADMDIIEKLPPAKVIQLLDSYRPRYVLLDTNVSIELMNDVLQKAQDLDTSVLIEPTSGVKCTKLGKCSLPTFPETPVRLITPTVEELMTIYASFAENERFEDIDKWFNILDAIGAGGDFRERLVHASHRFPLISHYLKRGVFQQAFQLLPFFPNILVKDGANGVLLVQITTDSEHVRSLLSKQNLTYKDNRATASSFTAVSDGGRHNLAVVVQHFPAVAVDVDTVVNVTGAGDSLAGCLLTLLANENGAVPSALEDFENHHRREALVMTAQNAAAASLRHPGAVNGPALRLLLKGRHHEVKK